MYREDGSADFQGAIRHFEGSDYEDVQRIAQTEEHGVLERWGHKAKAVVALGVVGLALFYASERGNDQARQIDQQNSQRSAQIAANPNAVAAAMGGRVIGH